MYFRELPVTAEQEDLERKTLQHSECRAARLQRNPVELRCRGFVATSTVRLMRDPGVSGRALCQVVKETSEEAERRGKTPAGLPNRPDRNMQRGVVLVLGLQKAPLTQPELWPTVNKIPERIW